MKGVKNLIIHNILLIKFLYVGMLNYLSNYPPNFMKKLKIFSHSLTDYYFFKN